MAESADPAVRTYEITLKDGGAVRVDIPETWKVTFGPIAGAKGYDGGGGFAFRAWEAETKQRLLLTQVTGFRDIGLPMTRRAVRRFGSDDWFADDGSWTGKRADLVAHSWQPIDELAETEPAPDDDDPDDSIHHLAGMRPRADRAIKLGGR